MGAGVLSRFPIELDEIEANIEYGEDIDICIGGITGKGWERVRRVSTWSSALCLEVKIGSIARSRYTSDCHIKAK